MVKGLFLGVSNARAGLLGVLFLFSTLIFFFSSSFSVFPPPSHTLFCCVLTSWMIPKLTSGCFNRLACLCLFSGFTNCMKESVSLSS